MEKMREIEKWLKSNNMDKKYIVKLKNDTFMGEMIVLYSVYSSGAQSYELESNVPGVIIDHIKGREHIA